MGSCLSSHLSLVPLCRAIWASRSRYRRPAPNALAADSVPVDSPRSVWASVTVHARPAPIAMVFVGPVLMQSVRPIRASVSGHARSAMSASGFHHSLLSLFFAARHRVRSANCSKHTVPSRQSSIFSPTRLSACPPPVSLPAPTSPHSDTPPQANAARNAAGSRLACPFFIICLRCPVGWLRGGRVRVSKKARLRPWSAEALRSPTKTRRKRAIGRASLGVFVLKISQVSADKKNSQLMRIIGCPAPGAPVVPWCPNAVPYVFLFLRACQVHSGPLVLCGERNRFRFHPPIEYLPPTPKNRQTFFKKIFAPRTKGIVGPVDRLVVRWLGS